MNRVHIRTIKTANKVYIVYYTLYYTINQQTQHKKKYMKSRKSNEMGLWMSNNNMSCWKQLKVSIKKHDFFTFVCQNKMNQTKKKFLCFEMPDKNSFNLI